MLYRKCSSEYGILWDIFRSQITNPWFPYDRMIAEDRTWFYDHDHRITNDCRRMFPYYCRLSQNVLWSGIWDPRLSVIIWKHMESWNESSTHWREKIVKYCLPRTTVFFIYKSTSNTNQLDFLFGEPFPHGLLYRQTSLPFVISSWLLVTFPKLPLQSILQLEARFPWIFVSVSHHSSRMRNYFTTLSTLWALF